MKTKITGIALAVGAAAMFSMAPLHAESTATADVATVKCQGGNACKGLSACKTATNACKGQNACKGKGVAMMMSKEACEKAGGTVAN